MVDVYEGDDIRRFILRTGLLVAVAVLIWLWTRDVGLLAGVVVVAVTLVAGHYSYQWGNRKSLENEQNLEELIRKKKSRPLDSDSQPHTL